MVLASAPSRRLDQRRVPSSTWFYAASSPESQRIKLSVLVLEHALKHLQEVGGGVHDAPPALLSVPNASHSAERRGVVSSHPDAARRVAQVKLEKGCHVAYHHHISEQISITISGRVHWKVGEPGTDSYFEQVLTGGEVMVLPSNVPHSVDALEDTFIYDIISPIGPMGVDSQKAVSSA